MNLELTALTAGLLGLLLGGLLWFQAEAPGLLSGIDWTPEFSAPDFDAKFLDAEGNKINR